MRTIIAGNWKMHKDRAEAEALIDALAEQVGNTERVEVIIAPPFPFLAMAVEQLRDVHIGVAAQNCHETLHGAFTGEVSAVMLKSIGVSATIVGHSERRQYYGETDAAVSKKIIALLHVGMMPIYCCGELRVDREKGTHFEVVRMQMNEALGPISPADLAKVVVAYEPVWAIGTGLTATPQQAQEMHAFIRQELRTLAGEVAAAIPILYGGSMKPDNAKEILAGADVNGGLIGGASLDAGQFTELVRIAARAAAHPSIP
ncbi:MAG: triose-phosphate isomerase [Flavobacteriales bacterium]|nr:triose-phosphate isomerase [Flavobacteriales bacterium]MBK9074543.1 triose-phosphate isomerase [Flavobacteriales bacterium]